MYKNNETMHINKKFNHGKTAEISNDLFTLNFGNFFFILLNY